MSTQLSVRISVIIASILWGIWEKRLAERNRGNVEGEEVKDHGSFFWIYISVSVGMTIAALFTFSNFGALPNPILWELLGISIAVLGLWIRLSAMRTLSTHFTHRVTILKDHVLIRDGLYRWIRHPSYLGQILVLLGLGCALANGFALLAAPFFTIIALLCRIAIEERVLMDHFGKKYKEYCDTTSRLLPGIW